MANVRDARPTDITAIYELVKRQVAYHDAKDEFDATEDDLRAAFFCEDPRAFALVSEDDGGEVMGIAVWYLSFSTWEGTHGIHLEDLHVSEDARGGGHGKALIRHLAKLALSRGYTRLEWQVGDWNAPSIGFYDAIGGKEQSEWIDYKLSGESLVAFANEQERAQKH